MTKEVVMAIIEFEADRLDSAVQAVPDLELGDAVLDPALLFTPGTPAQRRSVPAGPRFSARLLGRLSGRWAAGLTTAWVAIFTTGVLLEPAPADPDAALPFAEGMLVLTLLVGWVVMAAGFATRRRYGAVASLVAAVSLVGMTIACQVSGHHSTIGAWWWFQAAGSTTLVGLSATALRARQQPPAFSA
jgi:hypothetical protein